MTESIIWILAAIVFSLVEIFTFNMITIWFVTGSVVALIFSLFDFSFYFQLWAFTIVSVLTLIFAKPFFAKLLIKEKISTNADRIIGVKGIVIEEINNVKFAGKIKVEGQEWSATTSDGCVKLPGEEVTVKEIKGVRLIVE